jgi:hypothetical protein
VSSLDLCRLLLESNSTSQYSPRHLENHSS